VRVIVSIRPGVRRAKASACPSSSVLSARAVRGPIGALASRRLRENPQTPANRRLGRGWPPEWPGGSAATPDAPPPRAPACGSAATGRGRARSRRVLMVSCPVERPFSHSGPTNRSGGSAIPMYGGAGEFGS
jgi:hypothetical protein